MTRLDAQRTVSFVSLQPTRIAGVIGMLLPAGIRGRFPELNEGAEQVLRPAGYSLALGASGDDRSLEAEQLQRILDRGASGLIVYAIDGPLDVPALRELFDRGFPLVLIDRYFPGLPVDTVELRPESADPPKEVLRVVPAKKIAVGNVEIARS